MIRIGLPKGSVKHRSLKFISTVLRRTISDSCLRHTDGREWTLYLLKHRDIPSLLAQGMLDIGITSTEWVLERGPGIDVVATLHWCDSRISLIGTDHLPSAIAAGRRIRCVTEYPCIAKQYFASRGMLDSTTLLTISGSCEALVPDVFDCAVECIETGATLQANGLTEIETILRSSVVISVLAERSKHLNPAVSLVRDLAQCC